jgi:3'-phosphoadenosine 5'-phosphosulfate sulfotransferase (PAPS reductase)/FAD synthetase
MQFEELVKHNKIFPTANARYCTRLMKIEPFFMFLSKFREEYFDFVVITGERAEESPSRAKKPEREYDDKYYHCEVWRPLKNWTAEEVFEAHIRNDFPINPMYNLGFSRVGCAPCIYARQADVALMAKHFPEQIDKVEALEASLEDTSTKETPFYYFSIGMKIREYVQHCNRKTAYGSIEDHLPPESICAAHYAILCE